MESAIKNEGDPHEGDKATKNDALIVLHVAEGTILLRPKDEDHDEENLDEHTQPAGHHSLGRGRSDLGRTGSLIVICGGKLDRGLALTGLAAHGSAPVVIQTRPLDIPGKIAFTIGNDRLLADLELLLAGPALDGSALELFANLKLPLTSGALNADGHKSKEDWGAEDKILATGPTFNTFRSIFPPVPGS